MVLFGWMCSLLRRALQQVQPSPCRASFSFASLILLSFVLVAPTSRADAQAVDWLVNLTDTGFDPTAAGGTIVYEMRVTNDGIQTAPATTVNLSIPALTEFTGAVGTITGCAPTPATGPATVVCNVPSLASDGVASLTVSLRTTQLGTVVFAAAVPTAGDDVTTNNSASQSTTVTAGANLGLQLVAPATAASGSFVTLAYTVTNTGPNVANGVTVRVPVPSGLTGLSAPAGCSFSAGAFNCLIPGTIAVGTSRTLSFTAQVAAAAGSTITALGSVTLASPPDPISGNDTASGNIGVTAGSDVAIIKARTPTGTLLVGDAVSFLLNTQYTGDSPSGLEVVDTLPANYRVDGVVAPGWTCTVTGQTVRCLQTSGSGPGTAVSLGQIRVDATVLSAGTVANTATISSTGPLDPFLANNTASDGAATIEEPFVDLVSNKQGPSPALVVVGNSYDFTLSTSNIGNGAFFGTLIMTDRLPAGLQATAYSGSSWACAPAPPVTGPADITCTRVYTQAAPLAAGATTPAVTLTATATQTGTIRNRLEVSSPDSNLPDPNLGNGGSDFDVVGSAPGASADVSVLKSADLASLAAGEIQTFTLEVVNSGPEPSIDVLLTDNLGSLINSAAGPTGAGFIGFAITENSATGTSCTSAAAGGTTRRLTCTIGTLPICTPGSTCPVIRVEVRPGGNAGARTNTVRALSDTTADPDLADNLASAGYAIEARADVTVDKAASPSPVAAGQALTYAITARNLANGLSTAQAVTITDTLPDDVTFVSAAPSTGSCSVLPGVETTTGPGNNTVTCNLGAIANGAQQTVTVVVRPNLATRNTSLTNAVTVATATIETNTTNNADSVTTPVTPPSLDLLVNKVDSVDPLAIGSDTVYTVTVSNLGPSAAENVVMTDLLPPSRVAYRSHVVASGGVCGTVPAVDSVGGTLACTFARIPPNQTRTVTVTARGVAKGVALNTVTVSSDESDLGFDGNTANNTVEEQTTVRTRADIEVVSKVASPATINLRDAFDYIILVRNNVGPTLAEADGVVVTDTLPSGVVLTSAPVVTVLSGTVDTPVCSGAAGATSITCAFGTVSNGAEIRITLPSRVNAVTASGQVFNNTASVTTASFDTDPSNNSESGAVTVNSSSISGRVFRDFGSDGAFNGSDTGIVVGTPMHLSGTDFTGQAVTRTAVTDASGAYTFAFLPEGSYRVTQGTISEAYLVDGTTSAGSAGGSVSSPTVIEGVALGPFTTATGYLFPKIPTARVAIAKAVQSGPSANADGSFNVTFRIRVRNPSLEPLANVVVTDPLSGAAPAFGSPVSLANPSTDPMTAGTYTLRSAPTSSCGALAAGYDGAGATTIVNGATIAASATCTIDVALRVQPTAPLPPLLSGGGRYRNQATVTATGSLTGQTSATNPQLTDLSDNGTNTDPNGNGRGNEAGENDPTPVAPVFSPAITLTKAFDLTVLPSPIATGSGIGFRFTVTNSGNITLTDVTLADALPGTVITGGPIASLAPGAVDATTFTATYPLSAADLNANTLSNTATATGTFGLDGSGNPQTVNDPDTIVTGFGDVALVKTASAAGLSTPPAVGDQITYAFAVTNTGTVPLTGVTITDILPGIVLSGGPIASLAAGATDTATITATYALTQTDIDAGRVINRATVTGTYATDGGGAPITVTDQSGATVTEDADTVVPLTQTAGIRLVKSLAAVLDTVADGQTGPGDTASYNFVVTNTGNVTLADVTVTDARATVTGGPVTLVAGATDAASFTASYVLTQADVDAGFVDNTALTSGNAVDGNGVPLLDGSNNPIIASDTSDSGTDVAGAAVPAPDTTETPGGGGGTDGDPGNDPTPLVIAPTATIGLVKSLTGVADTNGNSFRDAGDTASYAFRVTNTGTVTLSGVTVTDPGVTVTGGPVTLAPQGSDAASFTATYILTQADVDAGFFDNSAMVTGNAVTVGGTPILDAGGVAVTATDLSDSGTDPDGAVVTDPTTVETPDGAGGTDTVADNDPTVARIDPLAGISLLKRLIAITDATGDGQINAGDTASYAFTVNNTGNVALAGVAVSDPTISVFGAPVSLAVGAGDAASFTGTYTLVQADIDLGYLQNTATATGAAVTGTGTPILDAGGNPVIATDVSDTGTDANGATVPNPETVESPDGTGGTDTDPTNDPTVTRLTPGPAIILVKSLVSLVDTDADGKIDVGDLASYAFAVTNTGNLALAQVTITDPLVSVQGGPVSLAIGATNAVAFTATYPLTQADIDAGFVLNTASVTGNAVTSGGAPVVDGGGNPVTATDISDTGTAPDGTAVPAPETVETPDAAGGIDGDPTNDPTVALIAPEPGITLLKSLSGSTDVNGNGFVDAGDTLNYRFTVTNTGNVTLADVTVADPLVSVQGGPVTLAVGASDVSSFTAAYTILDADVIAAYVENTATATGTAATTAGVPIPGPGGVPILVTDISDTGTEPDGDPVTDPETVESPDGTGGIDADPTNDPTVAIVGRPEIALDITIADIRDTNGNGIIDAGDVIIYTFTVTNTGDVALTGVTIDPASLSLLLPGFVCQPVSLAVGETATLVCTGNSYPITASDLAAGTVTLTGSTVGTSPAGIVVSDADAVASPAFGLGGLGITKTASRGEVRTGDVVTYTIRVTSASTNQTTTIDVQDRLPAGFVYQSGSGRVNGVATEPTASGRSLVWPGIEIAPGATATVLLDVLVGGSVRAGDHDNVARGISPATGLAVTADAIATVRLAAEPVFACSTVIGRVFDDPNQDGYYNGEPKSDRAQITDQTYRSEKFGVDDAPGSEKGLPEVRLIAPDGRAVTTDRHGRFSIPCAWLPGDIGANFMLKLDTRTLPEGYRLTTENPRVVRLTAGMLTKMNFGVVRAKLVRVDLDTRAFAGGAPRPELAAALRGLVADIATTPSMLRLTYILGPGETKADARQRLRGVERMLRNLWPANGRYQLNVETVIQRATAGAVNE